MINKSFIVLTLMIVKVIDYFLTMGIRLGNINANIFFDELSGTLRQHFRKFPGTKRKYTSESEPF